MSFTNDKNSDNYTTNKENWEKIKHLIPKDKIIWSPFYCDGKQKEYFEEMGYNIIHEDKDFFSYIPQYDICIDNPPFSKIRDVLIKLKEIDKPFILVCPNHTFQYKFFQRPFKKHLQLFYYRLIDGEKKIYNKLSWYSCYICYKMNLPNDIVWLDL